MALIQPFAHTFVPHTINFLDSFGVDQVTAVSLSFNHKNLTLLFM